MTVWFAWTGNFNSIHWSVPTIAGVFLDASIVLIFVSFLNLLTDSYLMNVASVMAGNTIVRSAAGAAAPLFVNQMFSALGVGGAGSLLAGVGVLLAPIPFLFYKYGARIRQRSKWAPTDLPPQKGAAPDDVEKGPTENILPPRSEGDSELDKEISGRGSHDFEKEIEHEPELQTESHSSEQMNLDNHFMNEGDVENS